MSNVSETQASASFFKTYRYVLEQKKKFDDHLLALQEQLIGMVQDKEVESIEDGDRKMYVPRIDNQKILLEAILSVMVSRKEMTMSQIMKKLENSKAYETNSRYFYTMVNNKLNRQDLKVVGPIRRGVYVYKPTKSQLRKMRKYRRDSMQESKAHSKKTA